MEKVNGWREALGLPVVGDGGSWTLEELEDVLRKAIILCATKCAKDNKGSIFMTLSGGIDSSFCLAVTRQFFPEAPIFTITCGGNDKHPDILAARLVSKIFLTLHLELIPDENCVRKAENEFIRSFSKEKQPGDVGVFYVYQNIFQRYRPKSVICHDGIDELLGGYWKHREPTDEQQKLFVFREFWDKVERDHLLPLERTVGHFGISLILPYLQIPIVKYISKIPVGDRTTKGESKIPLRRIAEKYLPEEIITRRKFGFCSALEQF